MTLVRRLEVASGMGVAVLGVAGAIASLALPNATQRGTALDARRSILSVQTTQVGYLQQVGTPLGIAIPMLFSDLALCIAIISLAQGSHLSLATLAFVWMLAGLLTYAALAATVALGPNFWPSAALSIVWTVLVTAQYIGRPGRHAMR